MPSGECDLSDALDAADLAESYLTPLHGWQRDVLDCWLAAGEDGKYLSKTCGLLVPRQNGKTAVIAARILFGLLFANGGRGERIAYSAHRVDTTLELFNKLVDVFGDKRRPPEDRRFPELFELVDEETFTNGHQAISLKNGAMVTFNARSTGSRRGFTMDVQIYDEAGFLTDDQLSASKSTTSSAPQKNPQTIYAGTPPSEHGIYAEPFARVRRNAAVGMKGTCWHEWSVESLDPKSLADREVWAATNPSLGRNLLWEAVESELADMSAEKFAIERLCWWPETAKAGAFDSEKWDAGESDGPDDESIAKRAVGVKFAPGGLQVCASIAVRERGSDRVHAELLVDADTLDGVSWLAEKLAARSGDVACVYIDGRSGAENLAGMLVRAGFPKKGVHVMTPAEAVTAATTSVNLLAEGWLTHYPDDSLDASVRAAVKRRVGTDGYGLGGDCCAAESMCAAVLAVLTTKRDPKRKQMIG